jgi:ElaB/YqjD/DUF883 family membrane-anchored ribosome-binding protein
MSDNVTDKPEEQTAPVAEEEKPEECPEIRFAAEAVAKARVELETAKRFYEQVRQKAVKKISTIRECNLGEAVEGTRCFVKKHPGVSVVLGAVVGFCCGRLFQKLFRR